MPWKECHVMDERLRFVARLLEGEKMAPLCAEARRAERAGRRAQLRRTGCHPCDRNRPREGGSVHWTISATGSPRWQLDRQADAPTRIQAP